MSLWSTCARVQEGLVATLCRPWGHGAEEALGVVWLLCSDTLRVRLCRLGPTSTRWTFWSLPGSEGGWLQGLTRGPRSRPALGGRRKLVFLCHAPCVTMLRKWPTRPCPGHGVLSPRASMDWGLSSCTRAVAGVTSRAEAKARVRVCCQSGS
jgi:hypothetical protein